MDFSDYLKDHGERREFARGSHVFRQGDTDPSLYFVHAGFLKAYYVTESGGEQIKSFLEAGKVIGSLTAACAAEPATFSLVCMEDCVLERFSYDHLRDVAARHPLLSEMVTGLLLDLAMKKERREYELLCLSAEQRYQRLLARMPELAARVTQQDIAAYLGITPVALSRIKKRLAERGA
ncbi:Crp/Fnr family transcriptional regulator [Kordiimonas lacus]|uniref:cAMP-binding domain of CRP or a regulatory subunit of cAMP-dependent protein kinases n=1 Tax=Kordiimonas lacus TaxID=637679 RepID=A0A1G7E3C2_9PROT|nr:Crp/Fnr family transcriptional regulator [Kordiimonas lacus]SDE58218.1 cAMP-binding domain of CRP or a regulatory subunit of cAMP-dependent protein kinases [Kordiimonas lacus]